MARKALPIARDIPEDRLARYADEGFYCMFETPKGLAFGYLSLAFDGTPVIRHAFVGKKEDIDYIRLHTFDWDPTHYLKIPDDTVIALEKVPDDIYRIIKSPDCKKRTNKKAIWGVTNFD